MYYCGVNNFDFDHICNRNLFYFHHKCQQKSWQVHYSSVMAFPRLFISGIAFTTATLCMWVICLLVHSADLPIHIHDLSRGTVAALGSVVLHHALLDGVEAIPGIAQSLHRGHLPPVTHVQLGHAL